MAAEGRGAGFNETGRRAATAAAAIGSRASSAAAAAGPGGGGVPGDGPRLRGGKVGRDADPLRDLPNPPPMLSDAIAHSLADPHAAGGLPRQGIGRVVGALVMGGHPLAIPKLDGLDFAPTHM